jgi:phosphate transport system substrate-binding protein
MSLKLELKIRLAFGLVLGLVFGLTAGAGAAETKPRGQTVRISGSTTLLPFTQKAAEEYLKKYPQEVVTVSGTGSGEGIKSLVDQVVDLAASSRDLSPEEVDRARTFGVELIRHEVARDGLAVIVHRTNPVRELTLGQLRGVYVGTIKNWRELNGDNRVIVPINRDSSSGTFEMWVEMILNGQKHRPDVQVQSSSGAVAYAVAGNRNAIGYVGLGFLDGEVEVVAVNGVRATLEAVKDRSYPISRPLYVFSRSDSTPAARQFLAYLLGPEGQALLGAEGYAPAGY